VIVLNFNHPSLLAMNAVFLFSGISESFYFGIFSKHAVLAFDHYYGDDQHGLTLMCYLMASFGFANMISSYLLGAAADKADPKLIITGASLACGAGLSLVWWVNSGPKESNYAWSPVGIGGMTLVLAMWWLSAALFAVSDAAYNTLMGAVIGRKFRGSTADLSAAFATFKFTQSVGSSALFLYGPHPQNLHIEIIVLSGLLFLAAAVFLLVASNVKTAEYELLAEPQEQARESYVN